MNTPMPNCKYYDSLIIVSDLQQTPLFFIIMRLNLKVVLACLCLAVFFVTISFWSRCSDLSLPKSFLPKWDQRIYDGILNWILEFNVQNDNYICLFAGVPPASDSMEEIDCLINQEYTVSCRREGDEIYVPFSFLHDYFEVKLSSFIHNDDYLLFLF